MRYLEYGVDSVRVGDGSSDPLFVVAGGKDKLFQGESEDTERLPAVVAGGFLSLDL
jgi:hypothetical protein